MIPICVDFSLTCGHQICSKILFEHAADVLGMFNPSQDKKKNNTNKKSSNTNPPKQKQDHIVVDIEPSQSPPPKPVPPNTAVVKQNQKRATVVVPPTTTSLPPHPPLTTSNNKTPINNSKKSFASSSTKEPGPSLQNKTPQVQKPPPPSVTANPNTFTKDKSKQGVPKKPGILKNPVNQATTSQPPPPTNTAASNIPVNQITTADGSTTRRHHHHHHHRPHHHHRHRHHHRHGHPKSDEGTNSSVATSTNLGTANQQTQPTPQQIKQKTVEFTRPPLPSKNAGVSTDKDQSHPDQGQRKKQNSQTRRETTKDGTSTPGTATPSDTRSTVTEPSTVSTTPTVSSSSIASGRDNRKVHPESNPTESSDSTTISSDQEITKKKKRHRHHHHAFVKQLLREEVKKDQGEKSNPFMAEKRNSETESKKKKKRAMGKLGSGVYRVRDGDNGVIKLRKLSEYDQSENARKSPLQLHKIKQADNFEKWKREAHLALPSNVGVPVVSGTDVAELGASIKKRKGRGSNMEHKRAYGSLLETMEKRFSGEVWDDRPAVRLSKIRNSIKRSVIGDVGLGHQPRPSIISEDINKGPVTFARKLKAVREMTDHMEERRRHKKELLRQGLDPDAPENQRTLKDIFDSTVTKVYNKLRDTFRMLTLWRKDLRMIHGRYGIGAATYFHWLRTIVSLNIIQTILVFAFVILPEIGTHTSKTRNGVFTSCPSKVASDKTCAVLPAAQKPVQFSFGDPFTGTGYFQQTYLYYSGYRDSIADPFCPIHRIADEPEWMITSTAFRFALMIFFIFVINTVYIAIQIKQYYQTAELESKIPGLNKRQKFRAFFSSWDFSVIDPDTAQVLHKNIWRGFKDSLSDKETTSKKAVPAERPELEHLFEYCWNYNAAVIVVHILMNLFLFMIYALAGYVLWFSLESRLKWKNPQNKDHCNQMNPVPTHLYIYPSLVMTVLYISVGYISGFIARFESWTTRASKNFAFIFRVGLYYFMTIGLIYSFFMYQAESEISNLLCHEDFFGHEIYRLIALQGFLYIGVSFIGYNIYRLLNRKNPAFQKPQFEPVNYTMRVLYLHTMSCIGFFYCPMASFLVVIRLVITFYHHKRMLTKFYRLSSHIIQTSDITAPFLLAYLFSYLTTTLMNLFLFKFHPSIVCGPFSHYNEEVKNGPYSHYYEMLLKGFGSDYIVQMLISPGFAFVFLAFLFASIYTIRQWGLGYLHTIEQLYHFLQLERKDRDFLLEAIFHFAKRLSKEKEIREKMITDQDTLTGINEDDLASNDPFKGVFKHRRGTLAAPVKPIKSIAKPTEKPTEKSIETGQLSQSSQVAATKSAKGKKKSAVWLPSEWHTRNRRPAAVDELKEEDTVNLEELYRQTLSEQANPQQNAEESLVYKRPELEKKTLGGPK